MMSSIIKKSYIINKINLKIRDYKKKSLTLNIKS